ncbi:hypothetical protein [Streptomyces mirabilis]
MVIYESYQQEHFGHWPQVPPAGLRVAVDPQSVGMTPGPAALVVTLGMPVAGNGPAEETAPGLRAEAIYNNGREVKLLADPSLELDLAVEAQLITMEGVTDEEFNRMVDLQETFLENFHAEETAEDVHVIDEYAQALQILGAHSISTVNEWQPVPDNPIAAQAFAYQPGPSISALHPAQPTYRVPPLPQSESSATSARQQPGNPERAPSPGRR